MKYRIIETGEGFLVQKKILGIFWVNDAIPSILEDPNHCSWYFFGKDYVITWSSYEKADMQLKLMRKFPIKHRGHRIGCALAALDAYYYVDLDTYKSDYRLFFNNVSIDIEEVKSNIDKIEDAKIREKQNKKTINIYNQ